MLSRKPYQGLSRKLVLAFDVGTTYSGVSYCILDPGEIPEIRGVSKYPAQDHIGGDNKIPSIIYYDQQGSVRAVGAEALQASIVEQAEDERWVKLEWWKLHLRAKHLTSSHINDDDIPPLPSGKSAIQVLADFMQYLFQCSRNYIVESHASGANMWKSTENNIEFILTHPNGWEGLQQQQIRRAAQLGGLVRDENDRERIHLLTEGEASLHFCVTQLLTSDSFSLGPVALPEDPEEEPEESDSQGVVVIDAGGGTVDLSAYSMKLSPPTSLKEIAPAECRLQGSVFVTQRAHAFLKAKLANSRFGDPDIIQQMKEEFDRSTKLRFRNEEEPQYIKFGTIKDKDPDYGIRGGQIKLAGEDVAKFFQPSVDSIVEAFEKQQKASSMKIKYAFLVGGYAASPFLYTALCQHPAFADVNLCRPAHHANKAVADGGVSFFLDHFVSSRAARFVYGVKCNVRYRFRDREHVARRRNAVRAITGRLFLPNGFVSILRKGTSVSEQQESRHSFSSVKPSTSECCEISCSIHAYRGAFADPSWTDLDPDSFTKLCTIYADTSSIARSLRPHKSKHSPTRVYYTLSFDVILLFGLTELKAQISWMENGVERRGPASIVFDE